MIQEIQKLKKEISETKGLSAKLNKKKLAQKKERIDILNKNLENLEQRYTEAKQANDNIVHDGLERAKDEFSNRLRKPELAKEKAKQEMKNTMQTQKHKNNQENRLKP